MIQANPTSPHRPPTAEGFAAAARRRAHRFMLCGLALALAVGGSFVAFGIDSPALPLALLVMVLTPLVLWHYPRVSLHVTFAAVCLFELGATGYGDALTDRVPFFWNVNTIFQTYAHLDFKGIPLNLLEVFLLTAGVCSLVRAVFTNSVNLRVGSLFRPIFIYIGFVVMGWVNGCLTGGDFKISLQEVRSQFYFFAAYLMAVNLVRDRRQTGVLLWTMVLCIGLKGILYTFRRYVTLAGMPLPDQGVGSHEEAFFFDGFLALLAVLALCGVHKRLQWVMWPLLPFVVAGSLATNRRAGTAALIIVVPIVLLTVYRALPGRRKLVGALGALLAVGFSIYYAAFRNSDGMLAQPARAIQSMFQPDARDASSNIYRDAENACLMATIKTAPLQGYGYGKRMIHAVPIADISKEYDWWDIMTHNQILWVWMRVGTFGFFAFWMMVAALVIRACTTIRDERADADIKAIGVFSLITIAMLMIFGLLDLQLSNFRDMLFVGFWMGLLAVLPGLAAQTKEEAAP